MSSDQGKKHVYDGIVELDNQLPQWWKMLFYITIVFAVGYYVYYEFGSGDSINDEFKREMAAQELKQFSSPQKKPLDEAKLQAFQNSTESISKGKSIFQMRCASCHGGEGQGGIGPNLTDSHWLHGDGKIAAIAQIIKDGVNAKGMPSWGPILTEDELYAVAAYVKSIKGSNPPGAKEPQGNLVKD